jgi:hypothetical protein
MHFLRKALIAGVSLVLATSLAVAAGLTAYTGPAGTNPIQFPAALADINSVVAAVNTNVFPANVGLAPIPANGHIQTGTTAPALSSCGGGTPVIVGSDTAGLVTMGTSATGCVITFATAYTAVPLCVVTWQATPLASQSWATVAASITLTQTSTSTNKVNYFCVAQQGG